MQTDYNLYQSMENIAHESAKRKRSEALNGNANPQGYNIEVMAKTLCAVYYGADFDVIVRGLEELEGLFLRPDIVDFS
jgi:hypothetical protein